MRPHQPARHPPPGLCRPAVPYGCLPGLVRPDAPGRPGCGPRARRRARQQSRRGGVGAAALPGRPLGAAIRLAAQPGPGEARVLGTAGWIQVPPRFHYPSRIVLHRDGHDPQIIDAPLTGSGYTHELAEVTERVAGGHTESQVMPLADTVAVQDVLGEIASQLGLPVGIIGCLRLVPRASELDGAVRFAGRQGPAPDPVAAGRWGGRRAGIGKWCLPSPGLVCWPRSRERRETRCSSPSCWPRWPRKAPSR